MKEIKERNLPKNPIEAQGMLIKAIYQKFGTEALSIIRESCKKQGRALGLKIRNKAPDNKLSTIAKAFSKSYDPKDIKIIQISDDVFQIQGNKCPFGLENTSRELCENVMEIDAEYFRAAVDESIDLKILKTVAEGDAYCDTLYKLRQKD